MTNVDGFTHRDTAALADQDRARRHRDLELEIDGLAAKIAALDDFEFKDYYTDDTATYAEAEQLLVEVLALTDPLTRLAEQDRRYVGVHRPSRARRQQMNQRRRAMGRALVKYMTRLSSVKLSTRAGALASLAKKQAARRQQVRSAR